MELGAGQKIGRYEILSLLGRGGMGEVYLARDAQLGRQVALKLLPLYFSRNDDRLRRFEQEARSASALNHPNIVTIYEFGEVDGRHLLTTEFIEGQTLRERYLLRAAQTLNDDQPARARLIEALDIVIQVATALTTAHAAGIIHRDIKPDNLMVRADGLVKVLDFGLAKLTEQPASGPDDSTRGLIKTSADVVMGTLTYMSPEQARGLAVDVRTDIWSLGVVLYEMLAGRPPFRGATTSDTLVAILEREPRPLTDSAAEPPAELQRIVTKALRKKPDERYQTVKDLLLDLQSLKQQLDFQAKLERSLPPETRDGQATVSEASETDGGEMVQKTPANESPATRITHYKRTLITALAVSIVAIASLTYLYVARPASVIDSIAVLPFANASNDPNTEYLSDGISEALINSLTELRQLRVVARATAFRYKGKEVDPQVVGRDLHVQAVLMGRVTHMGDTLNIQVDLVDATTGAQLWGKEYERKVSDVLSIKQAVAQEVTEKLRLRLSSDEQRQLTKRDTTNAESFEFYLRGRHHWNKRTPDELQKAIGQFQQALDRDPNYALGYVGLADCYLAREVYAIGSSSENLLKARAAADRALQVNDSLCEAHTSSAMIYLAQWRLREAGEEFERAISFNPNYPLAHQWFGSYFLCSGRFDDALRETKRAQELDPLSPIISAAVGLIYLSKHDPNAAIEECQRVIDLDPNIHGAHHNLGYAYLQQFRYEEAIAELQKAVELSGRLSLNLASLGYCYARAAKRTEALAIIKELEERHARGEAIGLHLATVYAGLGDKDQAFAWLEKDFQQHNSGLLWIVWGVPFEDLRSDPRYANLVRRMGLQP